MKQENLEDGDRILYTQSFLNVLFDDPLWDIGEDLEKGTIEKILKQWVKPIIKNEATKIIPILP